MRILTNPWKKDFLNLIEDSKHSIKITSPFVKENVCRELFDKKNSGTSFELITDFKLSNIFAGSLDLSGLELILHNNGVIKNYSRLHSKIYLFDENKAVISSGNLTNGGLETNFEYGIFIDDKKLVFEICKDFDELSSNALTGLVKQEHLVKSEEILSKIPKTITQKIPRIEIETPEINSDIIIGISESISSSLKGWKLDIFNCVNSIKNQEFDLNEVYVFEQELQKVHPQNQNIKPKIRQQIQYLRDLGLIEFLANGRYKKLWL